MRFSTSVNRPPATGALVIGRRRMAAHRSAPRMIGPSGCGVADMIAPARTPRQG
jgi:hypothetical protein